MLGAVTAPETTVGRLLIAEPMLGDPNFDRTVVLMIEHTDEGALGVVLNRLASDIEAAASAAVAENRRRADLRSEFYRETHRGQAR